MTNLAGLCEVQLSISVSGGQKFRFAKCRGLYPKLPLKARYPGGRSASDLIEWNHPPAPETGAGWMNTDEQEVFGSALRSTIPGIRVVEVRAPLLATIWLLLIFHPQLLRIRSGS